MLFFNPCKCYVSYFMVSVRNTVKLLIKTESPRITGSLLNTGFFFIKCTNKCQKRLLEVLQCSCPKLLKSVNSFSHYDHIWLGFFFRHGE